MKAPATARFRRRLSRGAFATFACALVACKGSSPPEAVSVPSKAAAPPPVDLQPVAAPENMILQGELARPEALLKIAASWSHLPLPGGSDLLRSLADDAVADAVDLSQPVFGAAIVAGGFRSPTPSFVFSVAVRSLEDAQRRLAFQHKLTPSAGGQFIVEGIGRQGPEPRRGKGIPSGEEEREEEEDEGLYCVLAPAATPTGTGGRLVCGEPTGTEKLLPYLTRTLPRKGWASDVHVEVLPKPVRESIKMLRTQVPILAAGFFGNGSTAFREAMDALVGEGADFVDDADRIAIDMQTSDPGAKVDVRIDYGHDTSLVARAGLASRGHAAAVPDAFWRLPSDTDTAFFGQGQDPKLLAHPRELLGKMFIEASADGGMTSADQQAVRDLVVDRMFALFTGPMVYGKGHDEAALLKAIEARTLAKDPSAVAKAEAGKTEQIAGWHVAHVDEPIAKVGPILKDWLTLWNRPSFVKWKKTRATSKMLAQMKLSPVPAGVTLPKDTVHLEIVVPQADGVLEEPPIAQVAEGRADSGKPGAAKPSAAKASSKPKTYPIAPVTLHVFAVPDEGTSWLAFGLDPKLVARKVAGTLTSAAKAETLKERTAVAAPLHDAKVGSAGFFTLRGVAVYGSAKEASAVPTLPSKGATPVVFSTSTEGPSTSAPLGSVITRFQLPRAVVEDLVRMGMAQ